MLILNKLHILNFIFSFKINNKFKNISFSMFGKKQDSLSVITKGGNVDIMKRGEKLSLSGSKKKISSKEIQH